MLRAAISWVLLAQAWQPIEQHKLGMPVQGMKMSDVRDTFDQARSGERRHEATDILAARGTPVLAVEDGTIQRLFHSVPGGNTIYQFDPSGHYCYYYAHLDRYAPGLKNGTHVKQGEVIGYVGTTGNAAPDTPHLHFGITIVPPNKQYWGGTPINPYPILKDSYDRLAR
jgi:murein DD-endopeptidase MepM/ murein hydrolase activator NlpD